MKHTCIILALIATLAACSKRDERDKFTDALYIRGRAFFTDTFSNRVINRPLAGAKILLSADIHDTDNYMYSGVTDSDGYFIFNLLQSRKKDVDKYAISYNDTIGSVIYTGRTIVKGDDNNVLLSVHVDTVKQNGMMLAITDSVGGPLPAATVWVYTSSVLAATGDPAGAVDTILSDQWGIASKFNIEPGTYYVAAAKKLTALELRRTSKTLSIRSSHGIARDSLQLR